MLDAVAEPAVHVVEGGEEQDERFAGDAVDRDGATGAVGGADPVCEGVEVG